MNDLFRSMIHTQIYEKTWAKVPKSRMMVWFQQMNDSISDDNHSKFRNFP